MAAGTIITLLTDFGTADAYVAEMKGVLLSAAPGTVLVDVTHEVPPGDVLAAQYVLGRVWRRFPRGTVHLAVVDPGVGTARRALAMTCGGHGFVGPDNGLFTPLFDGATLVALPVPPAAAPTFHGRDVFAPAAAALAAGRPLADLGAPVTDPMHLPPLEPARTGGGALGEVVIVDAFGNLVTNLPADVIGPGMEVVAGDRPIGPVRTTFADVPSGAPVAYLGSGGTLEIAVRDGSAAHGLGLGRGAPVRIGPPGVAGASDRP